MKPNNDVLVSIASAAADIQRHVLNIAMSGRCSDDRKSDINYAAKRISDFVAHLNDPR